MNLNFNARSVCKRTHTRTQKLARNSYFCSLFLHSIILQRFKITCHAFFVAHYRHHRSECVNVLLVDCVYFQVSASPAALWSQPVRDLISISSQDLAVHATLRAQQDEEWDFDSSAETVDEWLHAQFAQHQQYGSQTWIRLVSFLSNYISLTSFE